MEKTPSEKEVLDRLVVEHRPLCRKIAVAVHKSLPVHVEIDDLESAGMMGLIDAARKYDSEKKVAFSTYANHRVRGAIFDYLRELDWASRDMRRHSKKIEAATEALAKELERSPTREEVANKLGITPEKLRKLDITLANMGLVSASSRPSANDDLPAPDFPDKPDARPDAILAKQQLGAILSRLSDGLPPRYKKLMELYYLDELTLKECGEKLGTNESRASQIHNTALRKLREMLENSPDLKESLHALIRGEVFSKKPVATFSTDTPVEIDGYTSDRSRTIDIPATEKVASQSESVEFKDVPPHLSWVLRPSIENIRKAKALRHLMLPATMEGWLARAKRGRAANFNEADFTSLSAGL